MLQVLFDGNTGDECGDCFGWFGQARRSPAHAAGPVDVTVANALWHIAENGGRPVYLYANGASAGCASIAFAPFGQPFADSSAMLNWPIPRAQLHTMYFSMAFFRRM